VPSDSPVRPATGRRAVGTGWMRRHKITTGLGAFFLIGALGSALPASPPAPIKITAAAELHETPSPVATQEATPAPVVPTPVQTVMPASSPTPSQAAAQHVVLLHGVAGPDRHLTPGSLLSGSTLARIRAATRRSVFQAYRIAFPPTPGAYELDHLIPLELGGGNAATNLWPGPTTVWGEPV